MNPYSEISDSLMFQSKSLKVTKVRMVMEVKHLYKCHMVGREIDNKRQMGTNREVEFIVKYTKGQ